VLVIGAVAASVTTSHERSVRDPGRPGSACERLARGRPPGDRGRCDVGSFVLFGTDSNVSLTLHSSGVHLRRGPVGESAGPPDPKAPEPEPRVLALAE